MTRIVFPLRAGVRRPRGARARLPSRALAAALLLVILLVVPAAGQEARDAAAEARRLRGAGELDLAVRVLRQHLQGAPGDVDARWLLAETLYWTGAVEQARAEYARALADRPGDPGLRLDYARFLVETGRAGEARRVLAPLAERAPPGWEAEVVRLQRAILAATAPWARVGPIVGDDSQPLTRQALEVEGGFWPAVGISVALRAVPQRLEGDRESFAREREVSAVEAVAEVAWRRAGSPLEATAAGGVFTRDEPEGTDAIGEATVALRLPRGVALRGRASRAPYLWTVSSLDRTVLADGLELALDRSGAPGWAFQAGIRRETYDLGEPTGFGEPLPAGRDDNAVTSAWAWALAPVWARERASFRAGAALQWQDSEETRFTDEGIYDPYYTPEEVRVASAVVAVAVHPTPDVTLRVDGAVGVFAEERAPQRPPVTGPTPGDPGDIPIPFVDRDFTPWRARAGLTAAIGVGGELAAEVEREEDAFFESTRGRVSLTWRFGR